MVGKILKIEKKAGERVEIDSSVLPLYS